ncbi:MAG: hypothetical protein MUD12_06310 [Spirochaetes bacterium]|nr:hypothetical protein [Spirochaetota bacterium]
MSKESFRESIYDLVQYLTKYELSNTAKKLILHYYNSSRADSARMKALEAVEKYFPESIPAEDEMPAELKRLLDDMFREADAWEKE